MLRSPACVAALLLAGLAACSDAPDRSDSAYCTAVGANLVLLNNPAIATPADVDATIAMYRKVAATAPLAVEPEWKALVTNLETAATVVVGDPASVQKAADTARETQPAATRVSTYTAQLCGLQIGAPTPTTTPSASTVPPTTGG
jgi:outer membrane biosynthesis protein TonB